MDNHPIPQDVTGFQFKLIGNMTIKQFAYVSIGVVFAVILYYFPLNSPFGALIKIILIPLLGGSGFIIAFVPVEGRPIDVMAGNFIKALFYPNQFVYHKTGRLLSFTTLATPTATTLHHAPTPAPQAISKGRQLQALLSTTHTQIHNKLDEREAAFLNSLSSPAPLSSQQPPRPSEAPQPQLQTLPPSVSATKPTTDSLAKQEGMLTKQLEDAKKEETAQKATTPLAASTAHKKVTLLEKQLQTIHQQKQQLEKELEQLQKQLVGQQPPLPSTPPSQTIPPSQPQQQNTAKRADLPHVPDTPNVIVGIVKDPRGNVLPNMLVEVKDKDGNPVRAFKTNPLGQFASATPLASGTYTVELEDPKKQNIFQVIQLVADNRILLPIEIISHDSREELRKQLFN